MWAFMLSRKSPSPVIDLSSLAVSAVRQAFGTSERRPAFHESIVSKYMCAKTASSWVSQVRSWKYPLWVAFCTFWVTRR